MVWLFNNQAPVEEPNTGMDDVTSGMNSENEDMAGNAGAQGAASVGDMEDGYNGSVVDPNVKTDGTEILQQGTGFDSVTSAMIPKDGFFISKPYKREIIAQQLNDNSPGANRRMAIIGALRDLGVKVFIIEAKSIQTTADVLHHVRRVVGFVARENRYMRNEEPMDDEDFTEATNSSLGFQRCLLYQDKTGRLFNLIMAPHAVGPAAKFEDYLDSFSGLQALIAITIMMRTFCCASNNEVVESLKPAVLALIFGLVMNEEISLSWLNASMLIRASPSVSAHALTSMLGSDIFRKAVILCLALAGAATGSTRKGLTILGVVGACLLLLSNLGSRAWHFMGWKPLTYQGTGSAALAWGISILAGVAFPFMHHRKIHVGGSSALEHIMVTALIVGFVFVASGVDELQRFLLVTSSDCDQDFVNIAVGSWFTLSLVANLIITFRMPYVDLSGSSASDSEPLLLKDHASPVGFKVPSLPDFEMDPSLAWTGKLCFAPVYQLGMGLMLAVVLGGSIVYLGFEGWDETVVSELENTGSDLIN